MSSASISAARMHVSPVRCPYCLHEFEWDEALWSIEASAAESEAYRREKSLPQSTRVRFLATAEELKRLGYDPQVKSSRVQLLQKKACRLCPNERIAGMMGNEAQGIVRYFAVEDGFYTDFDNERVHHELPLNYGEAPRVTIPVIGDTLSGKTHFLASLGYALGTSPLGALGLRFSRWRDDAMIAYEEQEIAPLAGPEHRVLPGTPTKRGRLVNFTVNVDRPPSGFQPLVKRVFGMELDRAPREFHVTLLDLAGEAVAKGDLASYPGALDCDAMMFVVGPERVEGLARNYLGTDPILALGLLDPVLNQVEYAKAETAAVPLALVLTKTDMFDEVLAQIDEQDRLHHALRDAMQTHLGRSAGDAALGWMAGWKNQKPDVRRPFDEQVTAVSRSVFSLLHVFGFEHDPETLITRSSRHSFHAISATGFGVDPDTINREGVRPRFLGFAPRSVLTPLLTLLHQSGIVEF